MDDLIGCSSHMCVIQRPKGVGTNGPCLCKAHKLKLKLTWQDAKIKQLEKWLRMTMNCKHNNKHEGEPALCPMCREIIQKALEDKE